MIADHRMVDPITVEVIRAAMNAAAEEMKICMLKTTYSPILNEARDFGCAIFDAEVNMIAEAVGLPLFQGHLDWPVLAAIRDHGITSPTMKRGRLHSVAHTALLRPETGLHWERELSTLSF